MSQTTLTLLAAQLDKTVGSVSIAVKELERMPSARLATLLDLELLEARRGVPIASSAVPDDDLPMKSGSQVRDEIGSRYLLRYLLPHQQPQLQNGSAAKQFATPTPYSPEETVVWLALPAPDRLRTLVIVLDPAQIDAISGPRHVRGGGGIEYCLPAGFPRRAMIWEWALKVT